MQIARPGLPNHQSIPRMTFSFQSFPAGSSNDGNIEWTPRLQISTQLLALACLSPTTEITPTWSLLAIIIQTSLSMTSETDRAWLLMNRLSTWRTPSKQFVSIFLPQSLVSELLAPRAGCTSRCTGIAKETNFATPRPRSPIWRFFIDKGPTTDPSMLGYYLFEIPKPFSHNLNFMWTWLFCPRQHSRGEDADWLQRLPAGRHRDPADCGLSSGRTRKAVEPEDLLMRSRLEDRS